MINTPTTLASWASLIWDELSERGLDANDIFRRAELNPAQLDQHYSRFPLNNMLELWNIAHLESGDDTFGLAVGNRWNPTSFHALGFAWLASHSLGEALHRIARYGQLLNDGLNYSLVSEEMMYRFTIRPKEKFHPKQATVLNQPGADAGICALLKMCRMLLGETFTPIQISCPHPPNGAARLLEKTARCPIQYGKNCIELIIDHHDIEQKLTTGNDELTSVHEQLIMNHLSELNHESLSSKVQFKIMEALPSGNTTETTVANSLHLSLRTMQRKLHEEGINYSALLQQVRTSLSEKYIRENRLSVNEIAYLLGFSDQANFTRACKRWHGATPTQIRNEIKLRA